MWAQGLLFWNDKQMFCSLWPVSQSQKWGKTLRIVTHVNALTKEYGKRRFKNEPACWNSENISKLEVICRKQNSSSLGKRQFAGRNSFKVKVCFCLDCLKRGVIFMNFYVPMFRGMYFDLIDVFPFKQFRLLSIQMNSRQLPVWQYTVTTVTVLLVQVVGNHVHVEPLEKYKSVSCFGTVWQKRSAVGISWYQGYILQTLRRCRSIKTMVAIICYC